MKTLTVIIALGIITTALADEKSLLEDFLAKQPLPKSYSVYTGEGEVEYNYTADLGGYSFHGLQLRVWMTADKAILKPSDNLTLTVHYENISEKQIWVPDPVDWILSGFADIQSGAISISRWSFDSHSSPKILGPGIRSNFEIVLESPIEEPGFVQINLKWGCAEQITPNPITIECKDRKSIEPDGADQPATAPQSKSEGGRNSKPETEARPR